MSGLTKNLGKPISLSIVHIVFRFELLKNGLHFFFIALSHAFFDSLHIFDCLHIAKFLLPSHFWLPSNFSIRSSMQHCINSLDKVSTLWVLRTDLCLLPVRHEFHEGWWLDSLIYTLDCLVGVLAQSVIVRACLCSPLRVSLPIFPRFGWARMLVAGCVCFTASELAALMCMSSVLVDGMGSVSSVHCLTT